VLYRLNKPKCFTEMPYIEKEYADIDLEPNEKTREVQAVILTSL